MCAAPTGLHCVDNTDRLEKHIPEALVSAGLCLSLHRDATVSKAQDSALVHAAHHVFPFTCFDYLGAQHSQCSYYPVRSHHRGALQL